MKASVSLNGYKGAFKYNKTFIEISYQNIAKGIHNLYKSTEEANFSLSRNKFSVLKYIDDDFKINGVYEFILYYEELDALIHWNQTKTIHEKNDDVGYHPIHVKSSYRGFTGLAVNKKYTSSYLDGMTNVENWWYCIGATTAYTENKITGMPGPIVSSAILVNATSLWIRLNDFKIFEKLPSLIRRLSCRCKTCKSHTYIAIIIMLIS